MSSVIETAGSIGAAVDSQKLSFKERFSYSLGNLATNLIWSSLSAFLVYFYTNVAGIAAAAVGVIILISRIFDGLSDIGMGILVDKTKSKHGKARPWLLRMAVPFAIASVLCFSAPDFGVVGSIIYAFITYNLMTTVLYTSVDIPYGVLNSLLSQDQYQRAVLNIFRLFMATVAGVAVNVLVTPLVAAFGGGKTGWALTFAIFGIISAVLLIITYLNTRERVSESAVKKDNVPVKTGFKALLKNKYWIIVVFYAVCTYITSGVGGVNVFYCQYVLGDINLLGLIVIIGVIPMFVGSFILAPIVKRAGKRNTAMAGIMSSILGGIIMALFSTSIPAIFAGMFFKGLGGAFVIGTLFAMVADTIEYGEWKSGIRTEGLVYSAASFGNKLGNGIGNAILGLILSVGGYAASMAVQPASAIISMKVLFIYVPLLFNIIMILLLIPYKLDKEYPGILKELHLRKAGR